MDVPDAILLMGDKQWQEIKSKLTGKFNKMMKGLFRQKGAQLDINILASDEAQEFITTHAGILDAGFQKVEMSDKMRERLTRSNYIFSGIKTFHELNEAFPSMLDENGNKKTFERFLNDVQKINDTYNANYLHAEYNFVQASATMAAKWEQFREDGDQYYLQYRTAKDGKVRPEHAALDGVTLPPSDSFWDTYYPPNGWNCRCNVIQVRKQKYTATEHSEAMNRGEEAMNGQKYNIFRFNSGKQEKAIPDYNPYTIRRCNDCDVAKGDSTKLALEPDNDLCAACKLMYSMTGNEVKEETQRDHIKSAQRKLRSAYQELLPEVKIGKSIAKRLEFKDANGDDIILNKTFYEETINKYKQDPKYPLKLEYARKIHKFIGKASLKNPHEDSKDHPDAYFKVYEVIDNCYKLELKVKCNRDGNFLHILRVYDK